MYIVTVFNCFINFIRASYRQQLLFIWYVTAMISPSAVIFFLLFHLKFFNFTNNLSFYLHQLLQTPDFFLSQIQIKYLPLLLQLSVCMEDLIVTTFFTCSVAHPKISATFKKQFNLESRCIRKYRIRFLQKISLLIFLKLK